jgi:hypothetical protein
MASKELVMAVAATAELCGKAFSPTAAALFLNDLDGFDESAVIAALTRCRKELDGRPFNVAAVIARIDDGRPGIEEAWAMLPTDESQSTAWTDEMAQAWGIALPLIEDGDRIVARMAFKETYAKLVTEARDQERPIKWSMSFGDDKNCRQTALVNAVRLKRIQLDSAIALLPPDAAEGLIRMLGVKSHPLLAPPTSTGREQLKALMNTLKAGS